MLAEEYKRNFDLEKDYWWFVGVRKMVHNLLEINLKNKKLKILDVGCGTGGLMDELTQKGHSVWGLDISQEALEFCALRGHINLKLGSATSIPFEDQSFDVVTGIGVIEHLEDDDKFLKEVRRVLRPGGSFVMLTSSFQWLWSMHDVANFHKRRYYLNELNHKIQSHGFKTGAFSHLNFILFPLLASVLLFHRAFYGLKLSRATRILPVPPRFINMILKNILLIEAKAVTSIRLFWGVSMIGIFIKEDSEPKMG